jgi:uncharacterized protein (TIGR00369 family)
VSQKTPIANPPGLPEQDLSSLPAAAAAVAEGLRQTGQGALGERMGIEILVLGPDTTVARMPVAGNTQPYGLLHGGASAVLAESVGSLAAALHAGPDRVALGIELSASHHRAVREGHITATTRPLARTRSLATYAIDIADDAGRSVCSVRLTCMLRDA